MHWLHFQRPEPVAQATADEPPESAAPAVVEQTVEVSRIRETINLLESDLGATIREVQRACDLVCREAEDSAAATNRITRQTDSLVVQSGTASRDLTQLAAAIEELARSSDEIGNQVRNADNLTGEANESAALVPLHRGFDWLWD
jgi:methyl-accepting chemotaxis protein